MSNSHKTIEKNLHKGHRTRLKERFLRENIDHFEEHTALELLLFYAIPYKDTNELAHRLIARFGSIGEVMRASVEQLTEVEGMGIVFIITVTPFDREKRHNFYRTGKPSPTLNYHRSFLFVFV